MSWKERKEVDLYSAYRHSITKRSDVDHTELPVNTPHLPDMLKTKQLRQMIVDFLENKATQSLTGNLNISRKLVELATAWSTLACSPRSLRNHSKLFVPSACNANTYEHVLKVHRTKICCESVD